jgi:hypothetical protein
MLSVVMLNVVMLSVVILNVVAPFVLAIDDYLNSIQFISDPNACITITFNGFIIQL